MRLHTGTDRDPEKQPDPPGRSAPEPRAPPAPDGTDSATDTVPPGKAVTDALKRLIQDELAREPEPETKGKSIAWYQALFLLFFACDLVLLTTLLVPDAEQHPIVSLAKELLPAILGTALIAYFEGLRRLLFDLARSWVFGGVATALFLLLVAAHFWTWAIPVTLTPSRAKLLLDGERAAIIDRDGQTYLPLPRGLHAASVVVEEHRVEGGEIRHFADTLHLGEWQIVRALITRSAVHLAVPTTVLMMIGDEGKTRAWSLRVEAVEVPQLSRRSIQRRWRSGERDGRLTFWVDVPPGFTAHTFSLPPGRFHLQLEADDCVTDQQTDWLLRGASFVRLDMESVVRTLSCEP